MMLFKKIFRKITSRKWNIGFVQNNFEEIIAGESIKVKWLKHNYKDRWFADPFILDVTDDEIITLVEEFYDPINRGRLAKLTIDKKEIELKKDETILRLDSHLSFPSIVREGNKIYIYPENYTSGKLIRYEFDPKSAKCINPVDVCDCPLTDAIYTNVFGYPQIFSTYAPNPNGRVLGVFERIGVEKFEKKMDITFPENIARNAGAWCEYNGKVYRPAQECNNGYGHGISLQEVTQHGTGYSFSEERRITSPHPIMDVAFHTLNVYKNVIVVDCQGYRHGAFAKIIRQMRDLFQ